MESANIHLQQHQLQDHQHVVVCSTNSSALVFPSCYAAGSTTDHPWTPNTLLNGNSFNSCSNGGTLMRSRDSWQQNNMMMLSSLDNSSSMTQDLSGFHWANTTNNNNDTTQPPGYDLHLARLKNENSSSDSSSCSKITQLISTSSQSMDLKDLNEKLLLRNNFPSGYQINGFQLSSEDSSSSLSSSSASVTTNMPNRGSSSSSRFSQMFPTLNDLNNFNQMSLANPSNSLDMNLQALDLLNSARFNEGFGQQLQHGFSRDGFPHGLDHFQLSSSMRPLNGPRNISSSFSNGVAEEAKRSSIMLEPKAPHQPVPKKSRVDSSRSSCPPFNVMKVRKEKLGDRIAALQQMVAPFGKTDTASVLMEAIGYIKFLQNQVERLSVPYMKSSRNKTRAMHGVATGNESEESKRDLRSRGLCLVPVSCLSYVTDGGGGVWPPPNFGGSI